MNQATGLDMTHVPYKGSAPAVQDLIGGQTQLLIDAGTVLLPQVKGGKLKALAVTGPRRDPQLPDVPTVRELRLAGDGGRRLPGPGRPGRHAEGGGGQLATELARVLAQPELKAKFAASRIRGHAQGPAEFAAFGRRKTRSGLRRSASASCRPTERAASPGQAEGVAPAAVSASSNSSSNCRAKRRMFSARSVPPFSTVREIVAAGPATARVTWPGASP